MVSKRRHAPNKCRRELLREKPAARLARRRLGFEVRTGCVPTPHARGGMVGCSALTSARGGRPLSVAFAERGRFRGDRSQVDCLGQGIWHSAGGPGALALLCRLRSFGNWPMSSSRCASTNFSIPLCHVQPVACPGPSMARNRSMWSTVPRSWKREGSNSMGSTWMAATTSAGEAVSP